MQPKHRSVAEYSPRPVNDKHDAFHSGLYGRSVPLSAVCGARPSWSLPRLILGLMIQLSVVPIVSSDSLRGKGDVLRVTYQNKIAIEND